MKKKTIINLNDSLSTDVGQFLRIKSGLNFLLGYSKRDLTPSQLTKPEMLI